jgi:nitric oxide reductase large subunit
MAILRHTDSSRISLANQGIEERLAALEGAETARIILAKYAAAVDAQDLGAVSSLLDRAAVLSIGEMTVNGYENVVDFFRSAFADDPAQKSHFVTNMAPRWLGDGNVHIDAYFLWTAGEEFKSIIGWGTYSNQVKVKAGTGKFTKIELAIRHMGEIGEGWKFSPEPV